MTPLKIDRFSGEYRFLSNFYPSHINHERIIYKSVETAYQASKTLDRHVRRTMRNMTPVESKRTGQTLNIRNDWDEVKVEIMYECLTKKFFDRVLRKKLLETGHAELVEGNHWHDCEWGCCNCMNCINREKKNILGKLLMRVREEIREEIV